MKRLHITYILEYTKTYSSIFTYHIIYNPNTFERVTKRYINPIKL